MPREETNASSVGPEKSIASDEKVGIDEDNDPDEAMDEEVEYEEVEEEEEEVEEIEEEVEEIEEEGEEEEEEEEEEEVEEEEEEEVEEEVDDEDANIATEIDVKNSVSSEEEKKKHAELLSLPPHGSEVYIGGIPHDVTQEDIKVFCEAVGEVTEVRIMKGKDLGDSMGFAFVTFRNMEMASTAIDELNNTEFKGKRIKCSTSKAKHRLFIGNVPRSWGEEDLRQVVMKVGPGVTGVELVKDVKNTSNNRGFAFIDYHNHACADYSRQKMMDSKFKLDTNAPTVSWADPKNAESSAASQVKAVYVKNLPKTVTQEQLKKLFEHHGKITKVVLPASKSGQERNRIGFVHFSERSSAMKALKNTENYELDGQLLECSLARPQADQKSGGSNSQRSGLIANYPPRSAYGVPGGAYGALGSGYGPAGFPQPLIPGPGPAPPGMTMMPMLLPDGRIGYVLQQPGPQPYPHPHQHPHAHQHQHPHMSHGHVRNGGRGGGGSGTKSSGSSHKGRHNNDAGRGRRYHPY
ncbi:heterogeneous nuclear ribonucleoprotein Q-like [Argentina anserina]|uniref:heterogeneous nuclear ribonucleoprotein Q-like n=1 Tax=Argentina anserina TaxID=57926 RepID=UPI002176380B|nr:heterogeneous nuclear ribonucleoprotein Q-like [Potentilla anserina]XP_050370979.1 heterogeneous nuclear ribonucleoprotein Q-like [Potentilla anserina]